jgi:hypothetical protein
MSVKRSMDRYTTVSVFLKMQGAQPVDIKKPGNIKIEITGTLETSYPVKSLLGEILLKPLLYIYHLIFYNKTRRRYLEFSRRSVERLGTEIRSMLKIP